MSKKEKLIAVCFILSFFLVIFSSLYTIAQNKPSDYKFNIEKLFTKY